jgi:hypothetical protein
LDATLSTLSGIFFIIALLLLGVRLCAAQPAALDLNGDPLRPPDWTAVQQPILGGIPQTNLPATLQLQSVLISGSRRRAVINGVTVLVGERIGDLRLISIDADSVRLRDPQGVVQSLLLVPGFSLTPSAKPASVQPKTIRPYKGDRS